MKKIFFVVAFSLFTHSVSCQTAALKPEVDPLAIQKSLAIWQDYQDHHIMLSLSFTPLDENAQSISKELFLHKLTSGDYIPLRLITENNQKTTYQLYKVAPTSDTSIKAYMGSLAFNELQNYKMEGQPFPKFNFKDLDGNSISNESMKGKIVVIKCWYIHCAACIKEFPNVNQLAASYKDHTDMLFLSLAEDTSEQLKAFLIKKPLSYAVVPSLKQYMNETLNLNAFPTHFILDKQGTIVKVLLNYESLEVAIKDVLK